MTWFVVLMERFVKKIIRMFFCFLLIEGFPFFYLSAEESLDIIPYIEKIQDIQILTALDAAGIQKKKAESIINFQEDLQKLLSIKEEERSFENTVRAWDRMTGGLQSILGFYEGMSLVQPCDSIRSSCEDAIREISLVFFDAISKHPELYSAFQSVKRKEEHLLLHHSYYLDQVIEEFERMGCHLSLERRSKISALQNEISNLGLLFQKNIKEDQRSLFVHREDLKGLDDGFIDALNKNKEGLYELTCDYPTYVSTMQHCSDSTTRKELFHLFVNRASPVNQSILSAVIEKRDLLAKNLGFFSYAEYDLSSQMVKTVEKAESFIAKLFRNVKTKANIEFAELTKNLPEGVSLTSEGKLQAHDVAFTLESYRKKNFLLDERKVAEYFPVGNTIHSLISIYETFFSLKIEEIHSLPFWNESVKLLQIAKAGSKEICGYLFLDLFPRKNKFTHACHCTLIPSYTDLEKSKKYPALSLVVSNVSSTVLSHDQVKTLFHEFGHAMHAILGRSDMMMMCGTNVKMDFVELPSQLLEEWILQPSILKMISSHYITGESLPDELIDQMLKGKNCDKAINIERQCFLSALSFAYFAEGGKKDVDLIVKDLRSIYLNRYLYPEDDHFSCAFDHLNGYGAKYYGYLWAKVLALDVFAKIKEGGLLNPAVGASYVENVIGQGGSKDPNELLRNFLGRNPSEASFVQSLSN